MPVLAGVPLTTPDVESRTRPLTIGAFVVHVYRFVPPMASSGCEYELLDTSGLPASGRLKYWKFSGEMYHVKARATESPAASLTRSVNENVPTCCGRPARYVTP